MFIFHIPALYHFPDPRVGVLDQMMRIKDLQLEHIAPQSEPECGGEKAGYDKYNKKFKDYYIDCLGNYLLLDGSTNDSISNKPFTEKIKSYKKLKQQLEIENFTKKTLRWNKEVIDARHKKIIEFIESKYCNK